MNKQVEIPAVMLLATQGLEARAKVIASSGGLNQALASGVLPKQLNITLSEALVLGLLKQGVSKYLAIFGHGSTDLGEVLRVYTEAGVTKVFNFRNEVEMAHAGTALACGYGSCFSASDNQSGHKIDIFQLRTLSVLFENLCNRRWGPTAWPLRGKVSSQ